MNEQRLSWKLTIRRYKINKILMKNSSAGFTLLEVLIAMFILAFGLLAIAQMQVTAIRGNAFSNRTTTALTLAQDKIEELSGLSFDNDQLAAGHHPAGADPDPDLSPYTRTWDIVNGLNTKTVTVKVTWPGHKVELNTVISG
ncbi:MAG: hypothetical protein DRH10_01525 [Deltaproteobacteria bacterium]|nr:MAG: hypothetical protein DRH10_01525 [Deltaproteobacteria bacterium]